MGKGASLGKEAALTDSGWAGEKGDFFSSLLRREELFGIGERKSTELSAVAGTVQDRHF